jgi:hypothetical protein
METFPAVALLIFLHLRRCRRRLRALACDVEMPESEEEFVYLMEYSVRN